MSLEIEPTRRFDQERFRRLAAELNPRTPDPTGLRDAIRKRCYPDIFKALRPLPIHVQERLLIQGYTDPKVHMPNGEKLALELARINNINWFKPQEQVPEDYIEEKASTVQDRLLLPTRKLTIIQEDWSAARNASRNAVESVAWDASRNAAQDAAWGAAWGAIQGAARDAAWGAIQDVVWNTSWDAAQGAAWGAAWDAAWITVEDLMKDHPTYNKGNPFEPLVDMYEKCLWPIGVVGESFVVFHPEVESLENSR